MGLSFGSGYQFGTSDQVTSYPQHEWIANHQTPLTLKTDSYERVTGIGKGKFGLVFLAQHKPTTKYVAIKYITKQAIFDSQKLEKFQQEFNVLQTVKHPFLMECFGGFDTPTCVAVVCEFAYGGELYHRLKKKVKFSEAEAKFYFCEIASALHYLHDTMQLVYRDLKPENVLIDHSGHVKICDFGFTAPCSDDESDLRDGCGTAMYIAPEVASGFMKGTHGFPVDWWALGCVLYEMIAGEAPFGDSDSLSKFEIFNNITEKTVLYPLRMSQNAKQLLKGLLDKKPNSRSNWRQVSSSPWLSDVNWTLVDERKLRPPWVPESSPKPAHTMHFLKWDIAVPSTPPSHSVTAYCTALKFPVRVERPLASSPSSARLGASAKTGPDRASSISALRTERSSSTLAHQASAHLGQSDKHDNNSTKMIGGAPPSVKRKKSSLMTINDEQGELNDNVASPEKLKRRASSRMQRAESQTGGHLNRSPSRRATAGTLQVHPN